MNKLRKILRLSSHAAGAACLGVGFAATGQWWFAAAALVIFAGFFMDLKWPSRWLPPLALAASVSLAAVGVFTGAVVSLMLMAATLSLSSWDLALLDHTLAGNKPEQPTARLEKRHYQNLGIVLGSGLVVALAGQGIQIQLPFVVMVAMVAVLLYIFLRLWRMLND